MINRISAKAFAASVCALSLAACNIGEGIDARLDAGDGFDVKYHASLSKAFEKMTGDQQNVYNWAVGNIDAGNFIAKYGKNPTVRQILEGQIELAEQANKEAIEAQQKLVERNAAEISERKRLQAKALEILQSISATGEIASVKTNKTVCKGVVCDDGGVQTFVNFAVRNPRRISLERLECQALIGPKGSTETFSYDLDWNCSQAGNWRKAITPPAGISLDGASVEIVFDYGNAKTADYEPAIPESLQVVVDMAKLEAGRDYIKQARAVLL